MKAQKVIFNPKMCHLTKNAYVIAVGQVVNSFK